MIDLLGIEPRDAQRRNHSMEEAGQKLKRARERLNLRYRDVEEASNQIAARHSNDEFSIALAPVLFATGIRLFDRVDPARLALDQVRADASSRVTHLTYTVGKR